MRIRSFEVVAPLGAGGMGAVYRARDAKLGRDVALKFLQEELSSDSEYLRRFEREARAASALNHPNIITIYEIGDYEGAPYIAMELVEGTSLRDLLKKGGLPLGKLLDVAAQTADGLAAAHERGIVHRDLKPDNVMVTADGRVKILDFGLARISRTATSGDSTSEMSSMRTPEGRVVGTASYVSPEQASGGRHVDYRSDQFSFGSLLYELATGRRAFVRDSTVETLAAIVRDEPEPLQRINPKLPPQLVWMIERCLAKDPSDRYQSTRDLAHELRTLRDRLPETSPGFRRRPLTPRKRLLIAAISAAVVLTVVAVIAATLRFRARSPNLPNQKYLAVLPFKDLSGRPDGQLFSQGFADAVSARLAKYSEIQVIPPTSSAPLVAKHTPLKAVAQELGATLLLDASVQRAGDSLRVTCHILDAANGAERGGAVINGDLQDLWSVQDQVADSVVRELGIERAHPPTKHAGLDTAEEQDLYV
ncbi:MAG TPA: serine/threonine-protein kinase, partial [Thermoanaerobaculia bacterium]|nr:serine/threonine-protein kinase [Thermoanaerobaculia bacterium]